MDKILGEFCKYGSDSDFSGKDVTGYKNEPSSPTPPPAPPVSSDLKV